MEIAFIDSVGKDSLFYVKRGGSNQSKESVELELQRGFVAWRNEGRLAEQLGRSFSEAPFLFICDIKFLQTPSKFHSLSKKVSKFCHMQFQKYYPCFKAWQIFGENLEKIIPGDSRKKLAPVLNGWLAMQSNHDQKQKHLGDESRAVGRSENPGG